MGESHFQNYGSGVISSEISGPGSSEQLAIKKAQAPKVCLVHLFLNSRPKLLASLTAAKDMVAQGRALCTLNAGLHETDVSSGPHPGANHQGL